MEINMPRKDELGNMLNQIYRELELKSVELTTALFHRIFEVQSGYYSGHYHKAADGQYVMDNYPIPVVSVKGYCDIEIDLDSISVSTKLKRTDALKYDYTKLRGYSFEAYGVESYLDDYYHEGQTVHDLISNIEKCDEKEIGFAFRFGFDVEKERIFEFVKFLRRSHFYY